MTIPTEKLIELISEKSGLSEDDAKARLGKLIQTIRQEVDNKGEYTIERFGVFKMKEGELIFEPSETLSAEINYKYSGMKPIEIMEAEQKSALRKTKATPEETFEEGKIEEGPAEQKPAAPATEKSSVSAKETSASDKTKKKDSEKEAEAVSGTNARKPTGKEPIEKESGKKKEQEDKKRTTEKKVAAKAAPVSQSSKNSAEKSETSTGKTKSGEKETGRPVKQIGTTGRPNINRPSVQEKSRNDSVMDLVRTAGAIVLIALTVYFVYLLMGNIKPGSDEESGSGPEQAEVNQPMDAEDEGMKTGGDKIEDESDQSGQSTTDKAKEKTTQKSEPAEVDKANQEIEASELDSDFEYSNISTSSYGLRGQPSQLGMKGYTIVIYSFSKESNAREIEKTLLDKGFRVIVNQATVDDKKVWRVGIGQYPTIRRAQDAAERLPEPYNTKHFLKRINS